MVEVLTAAQMRELERAAIQSGAVTGLELMERAGAGVVEAVLAEWPELETGARRAVVLCGPGNNGGDGFVVARLLKERGWEVEVFLSGEVETLPPDARANFVRWTAFGAVKLLQPRDFEGFSFVSADYPVGSLIIDGLFGIGLSRPLEGFGEIGWWSIMCQAGPPAWPAAKVVAIDIPSGLDADSGIFFRPPDLPREHEDLRADLTVTFHAAKLGHYLGAGPVACGRLRVVDIGLPRPSVGHRDLRDPVARDAWRTFVRLVESDRGVRKRSGHKFDYGHALVLSGGVGRGGAARMAARGCLRIGAGLVTLGCPPAALIENAARLDAIMLRAVKDAAALRGMLEDARINALCLGPGLGTGAREAGLVAVALEAGRATVLDGDALTLLSQDPALMGQLHERCVLTPHEGEFRRLFPEIHARLVAPATEGPAFSKVDAAREAADAAGCTILFKGPDTVIADPSGQARISAAVYERSAPWLATAGSGDTLAGFVTGLLARGFSPLDAASSAAWLHVECALEFGPGLIAEDLPEALPAVLRRLGAGRAGSD